MLTATRLAEHMGTTVRTIHYYDRIGLFPPTERTDCGYRLYDEVAAERLKEILFYRELDFSLHDVQRLISATPEEWNGLMDVQRGKLCNEKADCEKKLKIIQQLREKGQESVTTLINWKITEDFCSNR